MVIEGVEVEYGEVSDVTLWVAMLIKAARPVFPCQWEEDLFVVSPR